MTATESVEQQWLEVAERNSPIDRTPRCERD
jgi:hypothetical protein